MGPIVPAGIGPCNRLACGHASPASRLPSARSAVAPRAPHRAGLAARRRRLLCRRAHRGMDPRLRGQQLPVDRRARRLRSQPGVEGVRGGRAAHHRPGARTPDGGAGGGDVAVRQGRLHHHRGQAVLPAPRDRLVPGVRRDQEQHLQVPGGRGVLDHHHAAGAQPVAGGHQRPGQVAPPQAARGAGGPGDRGHLPQGQDPRAVPQPDRPGQPGVRRRGRVPAVLRQVGARPQRGRGRHARGHPQGPLALQSPEEPQPDRAAPQHGAEPAPGQRPAVAGGGGAVEGLSAAALVALGLQRRGRVLRRVRAPAARRPVRARPVPLGLPDLHHPRPRHPAGRRARARGAAGGHRERRRRKVRLSHLPPVPRCPRRRPRGQQQDQDPVSPGPGGNARREDRVHPGDGGRPRLRGQQVQPGHPGAAPAGLDLQAVRLRGGGRGGLPAVARHGGRSAQRADRHRRASRGPRRTTTSSSTAP